MALELVTLAGFKSHWGAAYLAALAQLWRETGEDELDDAAVDALLTKRLEEAEGQVIGTLSARYARPVLVANKTSTVIRELCFQVAEWKLHQRHALIGEADALRYSQLEKRLRGIANGGENLGLIDQSVTADQTAPTVLYSRPRTCRVFDDIEGF